MGVFLLFNLPQVRVVSGPDVLRPPGGGQGQEASQRHAGQEGEEQRPDPQGAGRQDNVLRLELSQPSTAAGIGRSVSEVFFTALCSLCLHQCWGSGSACFWASRIRPLPSPHIALIWAALLIG
jgi:hypothetical protein